MTPMPFTQEVLAFPNSLTGILILIIALIVLWVIVSIPVYFAGKVVTAGRADFGQAMGATLGGEIVYVVVFYASGLFLGVLFGSTAFILGFLLALIAWVAVYRASFDTGWLGAIGIVIVAWLALLVLDAILVQLFGVSFPKFYPF